MTEFEKPSSRELCAPRMPMKEQREPADLERRYRALLSRYKTMQQENNQLREEIETFNSKLIEREHALSRVKGQIEEMLSLFQQIQQEDIRLPIFQARSAVRERMGQEFAPVAQELRLERSPEQPPQELLSLNIWLCTRNRFVDKILGHYLRQRDHLLIVPNYEMVKQLIEIDMLPDVLITGAYDFGLDDPNHAAFFQFLDVTFNRKEPSSASHEFYVITLSSTTPDQSSVITQHQQQIVRHEFISKLRGLQVTISEVRYFLEMRRCRNDVMQAELMTDIRSMGDVARMILEIQQRQKTGLLDVLSDDDPAQTRWAFQLFFLRGKLLKTEHTLESSVIFPNGDDDKPLEKIFTLTSLESTYALNPAKRLFFFTLTPQAIMREMRRPDAA